MKCRHTNYNITGTDVDADDCVVTSYECKDCGHCWEETDCETGRENDDE